MMSEEEGNPGEKPLNPEEKREQGAGKEGMPAGNGDAAAANRGAKDGVEKEMDSNRESASTSVAAKFVQQSAKGGGDENGARSFEQENAPMGQWEELEEMHSPAGDRPPDVLYGQVADWVEHCQKSAQVVLVVGTHRGWTQFLAEELARRWLPQHDRRRSGWDKLRDKAHEVIIRDLLQAQNHSTRCLVIGASGIAGVSDFCNTLHQLRTAIIKRSEAGRGFKMVYWMTPARMERLQDLDNAVIWRVDDTFSGSGSDGDTFEANTFGKLFGAGLSNIREVRDLKQKVVEQTLVRIAVLFGPLTLAHLDLLMCQALQDVEIPFASKGSVERESALDLWRGSRPFFCGKAGLTPLGSEGHSSAFGFVSQTVKAAAETAVWGDSQALAAVFLALTGELILFSNAPDSGALVEAFVNAAYALSTRLRTVPDANWIKDLCSKFLERQGVEVGKTSDNPVRSWKDLLKHVNRRIKKEDEVRQLLIERTGLLCRALPRQTVEAFLADLIENDAESLVWAIVLNQLRRSHVPFGNWVGRLLDAEGRFDPGSEGGLARAMLHDCAALSLCSAEDTLMVADVFAQWMPATTGGTGGLRGKCALLLPCIMSQILDAAPDDDAKRMVEAISGALTLPLPSKPGMTVADYWCKALSHQGLKDAMSELENGEPDFEPQSIVLFRFARAPQTEGGAGMGPLFQKVKTSSSQTTWKEGQELWRAIRAYSMAKKGRLPITRDTARERRHLDACMVACSRLNQI